MWRITSADPPDIVFVEFFREKYLLAMDKYINYGNICPPALCAGEAPDEKLKKINELGPFIVYFLISCTACVDTADMSICNSKLLSVLSKRYLFP